MIDLCDFAAVLTREKTLAERRKHDDNTMLESDTRQKAKLSRILVSFSAKKLMTKFSRRLSGTELLRGVKRLFFLQAKRQGPVDPNSVIFIETSTSAHEAHKSKPILTSFSASFGSFEFRGNFFCLAILEA